MDVEMDLKVSGVDFLPFLCPFTYHLLLPKKGITIHGPQRHPQSGFPLVAQMNTSGLHFFQTRTKTYTLVCHVVFVHLLSGSSVTGTSEPHVRTPEY